MQRTRSLASAFLVMAMAAIMLPIGAASPASADGVDRTPPPTRPVIVPAAPTNLRFTSTGFNSHGYLRWDAVRSADKYNIYVNGSYDRTVTRTSQVFPYEDATYSVVAVNDLWGTFSSHSESLDVAKPLPVDGIPDAPVNLRYYRFADSFNGVLQWDAVQGIEKYNVYVDGSYDRTVTSEYALYDWATASYTVVAVKDATNEFSSQSQPLRVIAPEINEPFCMDRPIC